MLRFVVRKMLSKKWMILSLLIGNILLISIAAGNPMYTHAVFQRTLTKNLENELSRKNVYPGLISLNLKNNTDVRSEIEELEQAAAGMPEAFEVDALHTIRYLYTVKANGELDLPRKDAEDLRLSVAQMTGLDEHTDMVAGSMYAKTVGEDGVIDAVISEKAMIELNLLLDDVISIPVIKDGNGQPMRFRITGVFVNSSDTDTYWVKSPSYYYESIFIAPENFERCFLNTEKLPWKLGGLWYVLLDYTAMRAENAQALLDAAESYSAAYNTQLVRGFVDHFSEVLTSYLKLEQKVRATLTVLQVPVFVLLAAFIFMVSRQMLEMEQSEIAVIKSRGAGKMQIFGIYLVQSLLISAVSFAAGIPLGAYLVQVLGSANAFLEFVRRSALPLEVTPEALAYALAASVFSVCAMVMPALRYARTGIVDVKRRKHRTGTPLWQKLWLDVIALLAALYGLYSFNGQKATLAARVQEGASLDPLLFLSSSLFMIGAALLAVRIVPLVVWCIYRVFRRWWSPALYASFLHVLRERASQSFIMVFLIMTIALGVFNAQAARTINQNTEDHVYYTVGADAVLQERWNSVEASGGEGTEGEIIYFEPDFTRYEELEGAQSVTKVFVSDSVSSTSIKGGRLQNIRLMGIHTKTFGETAWMKDGLTDIHWYHYLNAMSQNSRAVLVSRNFADRHGYRLGDSITYRLRDDSARGVIYGFVDYFPGFQPVSYTKGSDGLYKETENYLIVANLHQLQSSWGVQPYQVWVKNKGSSAYLYDFAQTTENGFSVFHDAGASLIEKKNDPVLQGTNGILTVGFIVVLALCSVGFLIFWVLSIQSRSLLFGIFRAMGMSMREVYTMLINEQLFISGAAVAAGAFTGWLTSKLYMPLIQLAYVASDSALPLELVSHPSDNVRLFAVVGMVMLVCLLVLGVLISRMKITQALKLGED